MVTWVCYSRGSKEGQGSWSKHSREIERKLRVIAVWEQTLSARKNLFNRAVSQKE